MSRDVTVAGGVYHERCLQPEWDHIFGSAGRAAFSIAQLASGRVQLRGYANSRLSDRIAVEAELADVQLDLLGTEQAVTFDYVHTLSIPLISPPPALLKRLPDIKVENSIVIRYGMIESDVVVSANIAVYDPQSAFDAQPFRRNGSSAARLGVVLNRLEMRSITGTDNPRDGANWLFHNDGAEVVVLKMGALGALVLTPDHQQQIPLYESDSVWKLGSGDVFSSTFAGLWAIEGRDPVEAADLASRATAWYCNSRTLPPPTPDGLMSARATPIKPGSGRIYLAAPFFDLGQRWLVEEARLALIDAGADVFSPVHEIGPGKADVVAPADLIGLDGCDVIFAILNGMDPGTVFEVGYARKKGIPIVALAENEKEEDLKMFVGSGTIVAQDFVTAIYKAIWSLPK
ncbi:MULTISPECIES: PfkB family carbohydrate kinase [Mesorhizobium]|uniref:PfkB family carbohydrate kinase n=1 Tax=Mesorhizobium calcicola TaxID=1300310 RepID=A0ABW4WAM0_9HYPH|nr:PfkB family carbohydrate kinase [Mesorhizobium sophorae]